MAKYKCTFDLITLLPGLVLGPHLNGGVSQSHKMVLAFLDGTPQTKYIIRLELISTLYIELLLGTMKRVPNLTYAIADVRDVAACHIVCLEKKDANGKARANVVIVFNCCLSMNSRNCGRFLLFAAIR